MSTIPRRVIRCMLRGRKRRKIDRKDMETRRNLTMTKMMILIAMKGIEMTNREKW